MTVSENEWEDIDPEETCKNGFVKVVNKRKRKRLMRRHASNISQVSKNNESSTKCDGKFSSKQDSNIHSEKHTTKSTINCKKCKITFNTAKELENHSREHNNSSTYTCRKCDDTYNTEQELKNHSALHRSSVPIKCQLCLFITERQTDFLLHMESHSNEDKKPYSRQRVCKWYLRGKCRYGSKCWNLHTDPPQCIYKNKCRAWPQCKFGHYEICQKFQECNYQSCNLEHPSKPFLGPACPIKTPNIFSDTEFPRIQRRTGVHHH